MVTHIPLGPKLGFGKAKWEFIVKAENGKIYGIPNRASRVLRISIEDRQATCIGPDFGSYPCKWGKGAIGPDGKIYCPPASAEQVLCINPETDEVEVIGRRFSAQKSLKWFCAVTAMDGKIYCPPLASDQVLCIDPIKRDAKPWGPKLRNYKYGWPSGALAANGRIYCAPSHPPQILMIDPAAKDARPVGRDLGRRISKWYDTVKATDGNIYCAPTLECRALCIKTSNDYASDFIEIRLLGNLDTAGQSWGSGALGHDGRIYYPPRMSERIMCIDPVKQSAELIGPEIKGKKSDSKWCGATEGSDKLLYCIPSDSYSVLGIDIEALQYSAKRDARCTEDGQKPILSNSERSRRVRVAKSFQAFRHTQVWSWLAKGAQSARALTTFLQKGWQVLTAPPCTSTYDKEAQPFKSPFKRMGQDERTEESVSTAGDETASVESDDSGSVESGPVDDLLDTALRSDFDHERTIGAEPYDRMQKVQDVNEIKLEYARLQQNAGGCSPSSKTSSGSSLTTSSASSLKSSSRSGHSSLSSTSTSIASTPGTLRSHCHTLGASAQTANDTVPLQRISGLMSKLSSVANTPAKLSSTGSYTPSSTSTSSIATSSSSVNSRLRDRSSAFVQAIDAVPEEIAEDAAQLLQIQDGHALTPQCAIPDKGSHILNGPLAISMLRKKLGELKSQRARNKTECPIGENPTLARGNTSAVSTEELETGIQEAMRLCTPGGVHDSRAACTPCGVCNTCAVQ